MSSYLRAIPIIITSEESSPDFQRRTVMLEIQVKHISRCSDVPSRDEGAAKPYASSSKDTLSGDGGGFVYTWDNINAFVGRPSPGYKVNLHIAHQPPPPKSKKCGCFDTSGPQHILKNVSGFIRPGQLYALMGASGAGKTTLLNVLHFDSRKLYVEGDRCMNGNLVGSDFISSISAYVQQEDLFIPTMTVREHLAFTARVRMDSSLSYAAKIKRVEEVMHLLGLTKCQNARIGDPATDKGISGGEMKRLAFASEYLTDPSILFCDEPTTGLDAFMAQSVVEVMRKMAAMGKAVICTIHQPASEVFEKFDHIYLLSAGRVAFSGTITEGLTFFESVGYGCPLNHNPADYFIFTLAIVPGNEEVCKKRTDVICDAFRSSHRAGEIETIVTYRSENSKTLYVGGPIRTGFFPCQSGYRASWLVQYDALLRRSLITTIREPMLFASRIFQTVVISIIVGLVFFQQPLNQSGLKNICGCLFILVLNATVLNCFGVMFVFSSELPVFLREHWNNMYRVDTYFLAKSTAELPFVTAFSILFVSLCYYMIKLNESAYRFVMATTIVTMVAHVSTSFGYFMSTVSKDLVVALAITPPILVPIFLFSGFFLREDPAIEFWKYAKYFSWFYYACELLYVNQWEDIRDIEPEKSGGAKLFLSNGKDVLLFFGYEKENWKRDFYCLAGLVVGFRVLAYLCLLYRSCRRG